VASRWAIATAAVAARYASFYPQIAGGSMSDMTAKFPRAVKDTFALNDLSSAAGAQLLKYGVTWQDTAIR
jgi:ABC-2 type transport system permease protein